MTSFRFLHAADIHLDSPLRGLDRYEGAPVDELRGASREALRSLVELVRSEDVAFVLLAGDVYDGDWKDYNTGLFFAHEMSKLRRADVRVFIVSGNHDAASQLTKNVSLPSNVHVFPTERPGTAVIDDLSVAIHGQGFARREVREDLSVGYPAPLPGHLNIGLLHTSAGGREGHENYAPCRVESLVAKGYDYWALGHVHQREVLHEDPWIVFPGNVQGRHIRESGPRGCTLVSVEDGEIHRVEQRDLDVLRWALVEVDAAGAEGTDEVLERVEAEFRRAQERASDRLLAVRVRVQGACAAHGELSAEPRRFTEEVRVRATDVSGGLTWVEKVEWRTAVARDLGELSRADEALGGLLSSIDEAAASDDGLRELAASLEPLRRKLPVEVLEGDDSLDLESPAALREVLDDVRQLLVSRLLGAGGGGR
ncbi:MAG: DNA repair exonuclease [Planctomycetota bacterium]|nr:DNA repair exonuclease [Planctomycetota bacterium]